MLNDINLKEAPAKAGAYLFISNDEVVYIGSSKNLYQRMAKHRTCINKGSNHGGKQDFYQFLQSNQFTIEFRLTDNYRQLEQQLIEKYNPKYNAIRAYTGLDAKKGNEAEYALKHYYKYHDEYLQYKKQYSSQLCSYNGETLTFKALSMRFKRKGVEHPTLEAKKYLINQVK